MVKYQQLCTICKKNKVLIQHYKQKPYCLDCQIKYWDEVKAPKYKKLFDIPRKFYEESYFLRNLRSYYDRNEKLTEKQITAFKKTVKDLQKKDAKA
jgi:hypothetical protein